MRRLRLQGWSPCRAQPGGRRVRVKVHQWSHQPTAPWHPSSSSLYPSQHSFHKLDFGSTDMARVARQRRPAPAEAVGEPGSRELAARKGTKRRRPREEAQQPAERDEKRPRVRPCSSPPLSVPAGGRSLTGATPQTEEPLLRQPVVRPGVPAPTDTRAFVVPDRPSPPFRDDSKACPGQLEPCPAGSGALPANIQTMGAELHVALCRMGTLCTSWGTT